MFCTLINVSFLFYFFFTGNREEFDVVPATESKNRSPVIHISHNLGIEMWCIKSTFMYCYENCFKLAPTWKKEHVRLERYTRMALLLNGNIATFWNLRKRLISAHLLDACCDLLLTRLVLSQKPKMVEALAHRRWILHTQPRDARWIETELSLCSRLSDRMKCNYHSWSHRQWVFSQASPTGRFNLDLWSSELRASEEWTKFHLSDHSGWHYRKFLLEQLRKSADTIRDADVTAFMQDGVTSGSQLYVALLKDELRKSEELILSFNGHQHETLWYYRRFLLQGLLPYSSASVLQGSERVFLDLCFHEKVLKNRIHLENHRRWLSSSSCLV